MAATKWTVDTLLAQILGEINQDRNARGGTVPTRMLNIVRGCYDALWTFHDWDFRRETTTLSAGDTVDMPADFASLDNRYAPETSGKGALQFLDDEDMYLREAARNIQTGRTACPEWAIVRPKGMASGVFRYEAAMTPTPDTTYTFTISYFSLCPTLADDGDPQWPLTFHSLWHDYVVARALHHFRRNDDWKEAWAFFKSELTRQVEINDRATETGTIPLDDANGDLLALASNYFQQGGEM